MKLLITILLGLFLCVPLMGAEKELPKDFKSLKALAEKGDADAQHKVGKLYSVGVVVRKNGKEAVKWNRKAAAQGHVMAQIYLGVMYQSGEYGVEKDAKEGLKWWLKAAEQGYGYAQNNLGWMYKSGQGVEQDFKEAVKWYRKAVDQGYASAQLSLGRMYESGDGVLEDTLAAYAWWNIAAANGF